MKAQFIVTFELEAKEDLDLIQAKTGLRPGLGSFRMGNPVASLFGKRSAGKRYPFSRLSIRSKSPANAGLERHVTSLVDQLPMQRLHRAMKQFSKGRLLLRVGVLFETEPPALNLPPSLLSLIADTKAELTIDYHRCSFKNPINQKERQVRAGLLKKIRTEQKLSA